MEIGLLVFFSRLRGLSHMVCASRSKGTHSASIVKTGQVRDGLIRHAATKGRGPCIEMSKPGPGIRN